MSTLLIRCPFKPFAGVFTGLSGEWEDLALAERFAWCLHEDGLGSHAAQSGIGTIESMPYADEALVLLPTMDVRLITTKVPLANAKKLQAILPTLVEEHVLSGIESLHITALPLIAGQPAMERTLALIDRAWLTWLTKQLGGLLAHRVRLIPDCLILSLPDGDSLAERSAETRTEVNIGETAQAPVLMSVREGDAIVYCQRTGLQTGVAWLESFAGDSPEHPAALPSRSAGHHAVPFAWSWALPSAMQFLEDSSTSKAPHFALNLLPAPFKKVAKLRVQTEGTQTLFGSANARAWTDPLTWQMPLRWFTASVTAMALGFVLHLAWLGLTDWRWSRQMELLAMQSLTPANVHLLSQAQTSTANGIAGTARVLPALIAQVSQAQHAHGSDLASDFAPMAATLQQLTSALGVQSLQQMNYTPTGLEFEFKVGAKDYSRADGVRQVLTTARQLGLMVQHLEGNRYRLEAYAGLGELR